MPTWEMICGNCDQPAMRIVRETLPTLADYMDYHNWRHLDGRPVRGEELANCDSCGWPMADQVRHPGAGEWPDEWELVAADKSMWDPNNWRLVHEGE